MIDKYKKVLPGHSLHLNQHGKLDLLSESGSKLLKTVNQRYASVKIYEVIASKF